MRVIKIRPKHYCWKAFDAEDIDRVLDELREILDETDEGDMVEILVENMTEEEYENLPEFEGY